MQVYFFPEELAVAPAFEQLAPALITACAEFKGISNDKITRVISSRFML